MNKKMCYVLYIFCIVNILLLFFASTDAKRQKSNFPYNNKHFLTYIDCLDKNKMDADGRRMCTEIISNYVLNYIIYSNLYKN